jgi:hypothetical protein
VHDGVVTFTGIVESLDQKRAAEQTAEQVAGVRAVAEELQVDGMPVVPHDDVALAKAVADSLEVEGIPAGRHITVRVEAGWVALSGQVTSASDYSAIERALECVPGLRGVTSEVHPIGQAEKVPSGALRPMPSEAHVTAGAPVPRFPARWNASLGDQKATQTKTYNVLLLVACRPDPS